jgi:flavin reductase (DIM6/NTAB) family NADH-FMN oxidoreductase RutF
LRYLRCAGFGIPQRRDPDAPPGTNELELAGLEPAASMKIKTPRVATSPVAFECRFLTSLSFGSNQAIFIGQIVYDYVADQFVINAQRGFDWTNCEPATGATISVGIA